MATARIYPGEVVIDDSNYRHFIADPAHPEYNGGSGTNGRKTGLRPRPAALRGTHAFAPPWSLKTITDPKEQQDRLNENIARKALASDVRNISGPGGKPIPSRDQDGKGFCWGHSTISAMQYARAMAGEPYADLSAFAVCCIIKGYRDEGGWGSESMEFVASRGVPTSQFWPQQSMSRANDKPETWDNAALHKWTEWQELSSNKEEKWNQLVTAMLMGFPVVSDFNWWSHSVCTIDIVDLKKKSTRIQNSWGDQWSTNGTGILEYPRSLPDDAWVAVIPTASQQ